MATRLDADPNARGLDGIKPETWFDHRNTPNVTIKKAVRASSSIPVIFQPVKIDGSTYVDGGTMSNVPHAAFKGTLKPGEGTLILLIGDDAENSTRLGYLNKTTHPVNCSSLGCLSKDKWWQAQYEGMQGVASYVGAVTQVGQCVSVPNSVFPDSLCKLKG